MKAELITETHSDLTVVNAARCSFDKESHWLISDEYQNSLNAADVKLITYLAKHNHWTPFAHPQEIFELDWKNKEALYFLAMANLSGFEWHLESNWALGTKWKIRGSLYSWLTNTQWLPQDIEWAINSKLCSMYPVSTRALMIDEPPDLDNDSMRVRHIDQSILTGGLSLSDELEHYTLRIHCPIFVKRQLETHRRNLVMTDIEDLAQNEVSRRYVDTEPEIYHPDLWRLQSKNKKQGSLDENLDPKGVETILVDSNYTHHTHNAAIYYNKMNKLGIAHEQSRMILPQSTYTTFWWTGSIKSFKRVIDLRLDTHVQNETRYIAELIKETIGLP